jgi:hypothetical protein
VPSEAQVASAVDAGDEFADGSKFFGLIDSDKATKGSMYVSMSNVPEGTPEVFSLFQGDLEMGVRHGYGTFKDQVGQSEYTGEWN